MQVPTGLVGADTQWFVDVHIVLLRRAVCFGHVSGGGFYAHICLTATRNAQPCRQSSPCVMTRICHPPSSYVTTISLRAQGENVCNKAAVWMDDPDMTLLVQQSHDYVLGQVMRKIPDSGILIKPLRWLLKFDMVIFSAKQLEKYVINNPDHFTFVGSKVHRLPTLLASAVPLAATPGYCCFF